MHAECVMKRIVSFCPVKGKDRDMSSDPYVSPEPQPYAGSPVPAPPPPPAPPAAKRRSAVPHTRAGTLWSALIAGFLILIVLLVFIAQNTDSVSFAFLGWQWSLPLGVAILLAAVCGGLITVLAGTVRIYQLRRTAKKNLEMTP
jgi:uncharacterized integral membrane protein